MRLWKTKATKEADFVREVLNFHLELERLLDAYIPLEWLGGNKFKFTLDNKVCELDPRQAMAYLNGFTQGWLSKGRSTPET